MDGVFVVRKKIMRVCFVLFGVFADLIFMDEIIILR